MLWFEAICFKRKGYFPLLMSPIKLEDDKGTVKKKIALVSKYLEMFVVFRSLNYHNYAHPYLLQT